MSNTIELKNAEISFSTMLNRLDKKLYGRMFKVMVPVDSPQLKETIKQYKELNELAKKSYGEQLGKKIKNAKSTDDVFAESVYKEGYVELNFNIYYIRTKEVEENGEKVEKLTEVLNPIYSSPNFCYKRDNNGNKVYEINEGKRWLPLSGNKVNIKYSLVAGYSNKNNQPTIQLKADEVEIIESDFGGKSSGPKIGFLKLSSEDEEVENKVEKSTPVKDDTTFTAEELAELDI